MTFMAGWHRRGEAAAVGQAEEVGREPVCLLGREADTASGKSAPESIPPLCTSLLHLSEPPERMDKPVVQVQEVSFSPARPASSGSRAIRRPVVEG